MRASSEWDRYHAAYLARLNLKPRGRFKGGWSAKKNNRKQWIQVNFKRPVRFSKVAMQGREDANQFVTSFAVAYSPDGYRWTPFKANSRLKVLLFCYLNRCCTWNFVTTSTTTSITTTTTTNNNNYDLLTVFLHGSSTSLILTKNYRLT